MIPQVLLILDLTRQKQYQIPQQCDLFGHVTSWNEIIYKCQYDFEFLKHIN